MHLIGDLGGAHGGISRYCRELHEHLAGHVSVELCSFRAPPLARRLTFLEHVPVGVQPDSGGGVYHFTRIMGCSLMLWRPVRPAVATVHDLGPLVWAPERMERNWLDWSLYRLSLQGLKNMDRLIADSEHTAESIVRLLGVACERVTVVPLGVDQALFHPVDGARDELARRYGIAKEKGVANLLCVGSDAPRKNLGTLLHAMQLLRRDGCMIRLIKVGAPGRAAHRAAFLSEVSRRALDERVTILDDVPDDDLATFYSAADVFVLPSYVEGFGLPVLEAMACGAPVVCSTAGALPEVAADAALLFDASDAAELASNVRAVLTESSLRSRLVEEGRARADRFTWAEVASRTMAAYGAVQQAPEAACTP